jgi:hypothetical protein
MNFIVCWLLLVSIPKWAPEASRDAYTYPVHFRGNHVHDVPRPVGLYVDFGLWVHFALLAVGFGLAHRLNRLTDLPKGDRES